MRHRTLSVLFVVSGALVALALVGLGFFSGGELTERWVSETPEKNPSPTNASATSAPENTKRTKRVRWRMLIHRLS